MEFKCILTLEVEGTKDDTYSIEDTINNFEIIFRHKDHEKIKSGDWPYGETPLMRSQKIKSAIIKNIKEN